MNLSDEFIMQKVKDGDVDRLALLFERYHLEVYNFFLKFSRDRDLSSDLTQNVFYRILKYKDSYKENRSFRTWMYMIARNTRIDAFKKNKISRQNDDLESLTNFETEQVSEIEKKDSSDLIKKVLSLMNHEKRELIIMNFYLDMSTPEISKILDINENSTRVRLHRAIKELRSIYYKIAEQ